MASTTKTINLTCPESPIDLTHEDNDADPLAPYELNEDGVLVFSATKLPVLKARILEVASITLTTL